MSCTIPLNQEQRQQVVDLLPYAFRVSQSFGYSDDVGGIAEEALCDAVLSWNKDKGASLKTHVRNRVRYALLHAVRRARWERARGLLPPGGQELALAASDAPSDALDALAGLPAGQRLIAEACWIEGRSLRSLGRMFGLSRDELLSTLEEIRSQLRITLS